MLKEKEEFKFCC